MGKKPSLTVVESALTANPPPRNLGATGTNLWREVTGAYDISDVGGIEMLLQLCSAADRVEALAERIRQDGEVIYGRNGPKHRRRRAPWPARTGARPCHTSAPTMIRFSKFKQHSDTPRRPRPQISLTLADGELAAVMNASKNLPYEKRSLFLERLAAQLKLRSVPIETAVERALRGLLHGPAAQ
jgi:hypothetical protein